MATPNPVFALGAYFLNQIGGLGVVHYDKIRFPFKAPGVFPVDIHIMV